MTANDKLSNLKQQIKDKIIERKRLDRRQNDYTNWWAGIDEGYVIALKEVLSLLDKE